MLAFRFRETVAGGDLGGGQSLKVSCQLPNFEAVNELELLEPLKMNMEELTVTYYWY